MIIAFYKGRERLFDKLIGWKTEGPYSHVEAYFGNDLYASASFQDGGVRFKTMTLNPANWDLMEVANLDPIKILEWFKEHQGEPYDTRGLVNFIIPVGHTTNGWFCNEALGAAMGLQEPWRFDPTGLACILLKLGGHWVPE